ncbi:M48 family metalloprotease [Mangrovivirga sp. M17]|uniref:M48 family metalloprotease n=1 Tax=Mangrovivirga halotolerans TaxID=2993936 RepID=A0ABT3RSP0_9BACT|nr:M56 family metallopeptidase [Mangrovivirga halotolerans]MCX2744373.1 M48 family metalloprotease [Mangrovivirga halotolerans]
MFSIESYNRIIEATGWTLVHALWQFMLIGILFLLIKPLVKNKPKVMYWLTFGALLGGLGWSVQTFIMHWNELGAASNLSMGMLDNQVEYLITMNDPGVVNFWEGLSGRIKPFLPELVIVWSTGALLLGFRLIGSYAYLRILKNKATELVDSQWNEVLDKLKKSLNINKDVRILKSAAIYGPMVMGHLKPVILIPVGLATGLPTQQVEAILAHELAHIKRSDYLVNFVQSLVEVIFFYHPMVWYMSDVLRHEREVCCDTVALNYQPSTIQYAKLLTKLEEYAINQQSPAMQLGGQSKHSLLLRIQRIVQPKMQKKTMKDKIIPLVILIVAVVAMSFMDVGKKKLLEAEQKISELVDPKQDKKVNEYPGKPEEPKSLPSIRRIAPIEPVEAIEESENPQVIASVSPAEPANPVKYRIYDIAQVRKQGNRVYMINPDTLPDDHKGIKYIIKDDDGKEKVVVINNKEISEHIMRSMEAAYSSMKNMDFQKIMADAHVDEKHIRESMKMAMESLDFSRMNFDFSFENDSTLTPEEKAQMRMELEQAKEEIAQAKEELKREIEELKVEIDHEKINEEVKRELEQAQKELKREMAELKVEMAEFEREMKKRNAIIKAELVKDGYVSTNEEIKTIEIKNDEIKVNGKKIKPEHQKKYKKIIDDAMDIDFD